MDFKRKGSFYKVTLTAMGSGSAELEIWPPKIFLTFTGTMGKELISEKKKKKIFKNWAFVLYVFSYHQPIIIFNQDLYSLLLLRCNRLLFPQKRDLAHRAPSAFQIPELQLAPALKVYALSTFILCETACGRQKSCKHNR